MEAVLLMARTSTITVLADCLIATVYPFVFVRTIVTRVAPRTVRLKCRILPDDYGRVVLVTVGASEVAAVVQWFERSCCVTEIVRHEGVRVVAEVALYSGNKVARILADRGCAVVAGRTGAEHLCVVNVEHRRPNCRRMTGFTNVCRKSVLRIFAGRDSAVVTADAVTGYVRMIEGRG